MQSSLLLAVCFAFAVSQVNLVSPRSRSGNSNIRVVGSTVGINPCGNGSDLEVRAGLPVATFWHGGNATNISISFGSVNSFWTLSIVSYNNFTGAIDPNATVRPLPIAILPLAQLRSEESVNVTTNGTGGNYVLREFKWPLAAAQACRPNFIGCALRVQVRNPFSNDTYFTCSDIRVYSHDFDKRLIFTVKMSTGVVPIAPATMLTRLRLAYGGKGLTPTNSRIEPDGTTFALRSDDSFTFTLVVGDIPGFTSDSVVATISADASTTLLQTLGVATLTLGNPPEESSQNSGETAAIVIVVLLLLLLVGGLVYVKLKKPATWKSWCDSISHCCSSLKPAKGTNI